MGNPCRERAARAFDGDPTTTKDGTSSRWQKKAARILDATKRAARRADETKRATRRSDVLCTPATCRSSGLHRRHVPPFEVGRKRAARRWDRFFATAIKYTCRPFPARPGKERHVGEMELGESVCTESGTCPPPTLPPPTLPRCVTEVAVVVAVVAVAAVAALIDFCYGLLGRTQW